MPHYPKPYFRPARSRWYVQIDGHEHTLAAEKEAAFRAYHALMQQRGTAAVAPRPAERLVVVVIDEFLDWCQKHRSADTYRWYKDRLNSFCKSVAADLAVDRLKPHHVRKWVDNYPVALADGSRRNLIAAVKRAMKWAEEQGYVDRSPVAHLKKPGCGRKESVVSPVEYQALLDRTADQEFKDLLTVRWEIGCRPQESLRVEARHVDVPGERWVFPASEAKGKKTPRVIYLTPVALAITKRLMDKHPSGPLFRNMAGVPWTTDATNCRFCRIKKQKGVRYSLYALRHTWINRMLLSGVDAFTVATLAGHSDPSMLMKHYAHLSQAPDFLRQQTRRVSA